MGGLYWTNGPMRVGIKHYSDTPEANVSAAIKMLEDFRFRCQRLYVAFDGLVNGRPRMLEYWRQQKVSRNNKLTMGTQFPNGEQSIGRSTIAEVTFGELFDGMTDGGEFDQLSTKALLVFMYSLWEETIRGNIADALQVKRCRVRCDLMGDLRHVRNFVVHHHEGTKQDYVGGAKLLPQIWPTFPDDEKITAKMLHGFMEQLNAIIVEISGEKGSSGQTRS